MNTPPVQDPDDNGVNETETKKEAIKNYVLELLEIKKELGSHQKLLKRKNKIENIIIDYIDQTNQIGFSFNEYAIYVEEQTVSQRVKNHEKVQCINSILLKMTDPTSTKNKSITTVDLSNEIVNELGSANKKKKYKKKILRIKK